MANEIVVIMVGQCGLNAGLKFWEIIAKEHGIDPETGRYHGSDKAQLEHINVFFCASANNTYTARCVLVDCDPTLEASIRSGKCAGLFQTDNYVFGHQSMGSNWAKGHYTDGVQYVDSILQSVQKEANVCESLQGFMFIHSLGGGTGSGLGSFLLTQLKMIYQEQVIVSCSVLPSPKLSNIVVESYNAVLSIGPLTQDADLCFLFDNESLYGTCLNEMKWATPTYDDINAFIADAITAITTPLRFNNLANTHSFREMINRLVSPDTPNLHFFSIDATPLISRHLVRGQTINAPLKEPNIATKLIGNTETLLIQLKKLNEQFNILFKRHAFLVSYVREGMVDTDFSDAESNLFDLIDGYSNC